MLVPACDGTETPFTVNGRRWLYCYDTDLKQHGYLDIDNDIVVWNRSFHPAFSPEFEYVPEVEANAHNQKKVESEHPINPYPDFYF